MQRVKDRLTSDKPVKWLFYGDSITHGALHTLGWRDYVELFSERIRFEMGRGLDVVINTAISGHTAQALLGSFDWRVAQFQPDVMFLMIGMNDCAQGDPAALEAFEANLHRLCERTEEWGGLTVLQTTSLILPGSCPEREQSFDAFMDKVRLVAKARQLPLVDHTAYWRANEDRQYYWNSNSFHPNEYGHRAFAKHLFEELGIWEASESVTCRLLIP